MTIGAVGARSSLLVQSISDTRARLEGLYGAAASLVLENAESGGARVRIRIPYRPSTGEAADAS